MMKNSLIAFACATLLSTTALAQYVVPQRIGMGPPEHAAARAAQLLAEYNAKYRGNATEGRKILDELHANGIDKRAENVQIIRTLLVSKVTEAEKVALARILGAAYTPDNKTGMNSMIVHDLRALSQSAPKEVARAATLSFSRLAYFHDSPDVLFSAWNRGLIDTDEYFGELAHLTPFAPAKDQFHLVTMIRNGKNQYASEILAYLSHDTAISKGFSLETKTQILSLLEANEPEFPKPIGELDYTDAIKYSIWLHAIASLARDSSDVSYHETVMARLNDPKTDPRKVMGFLASTEGKRFIKDVGKRGPLEPLQQRVSLYSRQLPQNFIMKELTAEVTATMQTLME